LPPVFCFCPQPESSATANTIARISAIFFMVFSPFSKYAAIAGRFFSLPAAFLRSGRVFMRSFARVM
jgi:hypothetical protein